MPAGRHIQTTGYPDYRYKNEIKQEIYSSWSPFYSKTESNIKISVAGNGTTLAPNEMANGDNPIPDNQ